MKSKIINHILFFIFILSAVANGEGEIYQSPPPKGRLYVEGNENNSFGVYTYLRVKTVPKKSGEIITREIDSILELKQLTGDEVNGKILITYAKESSFQYGEYYWYYQSMVNRMEDLGLHGLILCNNNTETSWNWPEIWLPLRRKNASLVVGVVNGKDVESLRTFLSNNSNNNNNNQIFTLENNEEAIVLYRDYFSQWSISNYVVAALVTSATITKLVFFILHLVDVSRIKLGGNTVGLIKGIQQATKGKKMVLLSFLFLCCGSLCEIFHVILILPLYNGEVATVKEGLQSGDILFVLMYGFLIIAIDLRTLQFSTLAFVPKNVQKFFQLCFISLIVLTGFFAILQFIIIGANLNDAVFVAKYGMAVIIFCSVILILLACMYLRMKLLTISKLDGVKEFLSALNLFMILFVPVAIASSIFLLLPVFGVTLHFYLYLITNILLLLMSVGFLIVTAPEVITRRNQSKNDSSESGRTTTRKTTNRASTRSGGSGESRHGDSKSYVTSVGAESFEEDNDV